MLTDHSALKSLLNTPHPSGKLARWGLTLQELDLNIQYRPGKPNPVADSLSHISPNAETNQYIKDENQEAPLEPTPLTDATIDNLQPIYLVDLKMNVNGLSYKQLMERQPN